MVRFLTGCDCLIHLAHRSQGSRHMCCKTQKPQIILSICPKLRCPSTPNLSLFRTRFAGSGGPSLPIAGVLPRAQRVSANEMSCGPIAIACGCIVFSVIVGAWKILFTRILGSFYDGHCYLSVLSMLRAEHSESFVAKPPVNCSLHATCLFFRF